MGIAGAEEQKGSVTGGTNGDHERNLGPDRSCFYDTDRTVAAAIEGIAKQALVYFSSQKVSHSKSDQSHTQASAYCCPQMRFLHYSPGGKTPAHTDLSRTRFL